MSDKKKVVTIFRTFRTIVKKIGDEEGVIDMLIPMSTGSVDRHGESIDPKGWKKSLKDFKKRPILLSSHNYQALQNQIGELLDIQIIEEGLLAKPKYYVNQGNPEADWGYFLATKGMAAFSVGFIPIKWVDSKDEPKRTYTEQELIEISQVTVPSNRDAIQGLQAKGIDDPVVKEVVEEILKDKEAIDFNDSRLLIPLEKAREMFFNMAKDSDNMPDPRKAEESFLKKLEGKPGETEKEKAANEALVKAIITEAFKEGIKIEDIDVEKLKASIEKDEKEIADAEKNVDNLLKIYEMVKENKELKEKLKDIELKAGAVLNAKNKANLKQAQALIQEVLDSAGTEEGFTFDEYNAKWKEALDKEDNERNEKNNTKKADTVITITDTKKEDPLKDEAKNENTITIDDKILKEAIAKALNYTLGITNK